MEKEWRVGGEVFGMDPHLLPPELLAHAHRDPTYGGPGGRSIDRSHEEASVAMARANVLRPHSFSSHEGGEGMRRGGYDSEWDDLLALVEDYCRQQKHRETEMQAMEVALRRAKPHLALALRSEWEGEEAEGGEGEEGVHLFPSSTPVPAALEREGEASRTRTPLLQQMVASARQQFMAAQEREWRQLLPTIERKFLVFRRRALLLSFAVNVVLPLCLAAQLGDLDFAGMSSLVLLAADSANAKTQRGRVEVEGGEEREAERDASKAKRKLWGSILRSYFHVLCRVPR